MHALVIERQLERRLFLGPVGFFRQKTDLLVVAVLHVTEFGRQIAFRRFVLLSGKILCLGRHIVKVERPELASAEQADQRCACQQGLAQPIAGSSWCITGTYNHEQPSPKTDHKTNGQRHMPGWRALFGLRKGAMIPQTVPDSLKSE
ncbi:hypothetical protein D3C79_444270 [compost metagenome]